MGELFYELRDLFEFGMLCGPEDFKQNHLGGAYDGPFGGEPANSGTLVRSGAGGNGILDNSDTVPSLEQIACGLIDTNVGLDAA